MPLILRPPRLEDEAAALELHRQLLHDDFQFLLKSGTWPEILRQIKFEAAGVDLPAGRVRGEFLFAEVDGRIVGRTSIRYELTDYLREIGGHVGYAVGPQFRRRGYATEILRQSVQRLRDVGVDRVLVTCDDDNTASARTIEACGGVLENTVANGAKAKRRYWISNK